MEKVFLDLQTEKKFGKGRLKRGERVKGLGGSITTVIVDGANVIRATAEPSLENLKRVLDFLEGKNLGYEVILDASVRYDFGCIASLPACFKEDFRKGRTERLEEEFEERGIDSGKLQIRKRDYPFKVIGDDTHLVSIGGGRVTVFDPDDEERRELETMLEREGFELVLPKTDADLQIIERMRMYPHSKILSNDKFDRFKHDFPLLKDESRFIRFRIEAGAIKIGEKSKDEESKPSFPSGLEEKMRKAGL
ncbi:hypothetical protein AKJ37_05335 [candidate division MSBL1 archaeon SCGC-AAA259I09]|uniref:RNase NYN domain-containing protein n=1 Tax=candidate division MSBL1 archaeon SCGC-AAA259I09 TaxID=1698267 RepID=A0A133UQM2_9EURY|nr:hypothetical protein AKJ37_05335 [candidate division MSBL1 archaeon SCGC-AAA259I09]